jgi:hypothetical protein
MAPRKRAATKKAAAKESAPPKPLKRGPLEETSPNGYRALSDPAQLEPESEPRAHADDNGGA